MFKVFILTGIKMGNCPKCGTKINEDGNFCEECGYSIRGGQYNKPPLLASQWGGQGTRSSTIKIFVVVLIIVILVFFALLWWGGLYTYSPMHVKIITNDSWNGTISDWNGSREISGYGTETINIHGGDVKVTIRGNSSTESLVVQIIRSHDSKILAEGSTTIPNGVVNVSYSY
jgi:hypothetical protein